MRCVTAASFSSPGPAPRLQPPCSVSALSIFPACCVHVRHGRLLHHWKLLQRPWAVVARLTCCVPPVASLLSTCGSTPAFFAVCANVDQGDRHTLTSAQSWRADFWNVLFENYHFWGMSVLSPAYQCGIFNCFLLLLNFLFLFSWCSLFFECNDPQVPCHQERSGRHLKGVVGNPGCEGTRWVKQTAAASQRKPVCTVETC